jgi:hypothetical protein
MRFTLRARTRPWILFRKVIGFAIGVIEPARLVAVSHPLPLLLPLFAVHARGMLTLRISLWKGLSCQMHIHLPTRCRSPVRRHCVVCAEPAPPRQTAQTVPFSALRVVPLDPERHHRTQRDRHDRADAGRQQQQQQAGQRPSLPIAALWCGHLWPRWHRVAVVAVVGVYLIARTLRQLLRSRAACCLVGWTRLCSVGSSL